MKRFVPMLALAVASPPAALAGSCDRHVARADTATGEALLEAFRDLAACSTEEAEAAFPTFLRSAGEVDAVIALSLEAIEAQIYPAVWGMLDAIRDYGQRSTITRGIGAACEDTPEVVQFLQAAYFAVRGIQFRQWEGALRACESEALLDWTRSVVAKPPTSSYDEKYSAMMATLVRHTGADALPALQRAAIEAAHRGGPFTAIIESMEQAVRPRALGEEMSDEDRERLQAAFVSVAGEVGPEQAARVADRLYNIGSHEAAASLLPRVYPERVQSDGTLLYGAASVEACDGQAILHYAVVREPGSRWSILSDIEEPLQGFRSRLRCDAEQPWPVLATSEPVPSPSEVEDWADRMAEEWETEDRSVRTRRERPITLP